MGPGFGRSRRHLRRTGALRDLAYTPATIGHSPHLDRRRPHDQRTRPQARFPGRAVESAVPAPCSGGRTWWITGCPNFGDHEAASGSWQRRTLPGADFLWLIVQHVLPRGLRHACNHSFLHANGKRLIALLPLLLKLDPGRFTPTPKERPQPHCPCDCAVMTLVRTRVRRDGYTSIAAFLIAPSTTASVAHWPGGSAPPQSGTGHQLPHAEPRGRRCQPADEEKPALGASRTNRNRQPACMIVRSAPPSDRTADILTNLFSEHAALAQDRARPTNKSDGGRARSYLIR